NGDTAKLAASRMHHSRDFNCKPEYAKSGAREHDGVTTNWMREPAGYVGSRARPPPANWRGRGADGRDRRRLRPGQPKWRLLQGHRHCQTPQPWLTESRMR